jgi:general secretion pathway protein A
MYLNYYGLKKEPFSISPDPAFLWYGPKHREAFAALRYGILEEKGFLCLTGEVGTGKTVLIRNLINTIEVPAIIISVPDPDMKPFEFFRYVANEIRLKGKFRSKADFLMQFQMHINAAFGTDTRVLMIIDEAQRLDFALLEQVRLLSNIVSTRMRQLNIFLVGQKELDDLLLDERARATRQRIVVRHKLEPLATGEVTAYIYHRMQVAGADKVIFMPDAIEAIALQTNGIPRAINVICDQALLRGYQERALAINSEIVNACPAAKELPQTTIEVNKGKSTLRDTLKFEASDQDATFGDAPQTNEPLQLRQAAVAFLTVATLLSGFGAYQYFYSERGASDHRVVSEDAPQLLMDEPVWLEQPAAMRRGKSGLASDTHATVRTERPDKVPGKMGLPRSVEKNKTISAPEVETQSIPFQDNQAKGERENRLLQHVSSEDDAGAKTGTMSAQVGKAAADDQAANRVGRGQKKRSKLILYFKFDSTELKAESADNFRRFISDISSDSNVIFMVAGYTDSIGDYWYNKKLSQRRADAVRDLLIEGGMNYSNIITMGMGSDDPQAGRDSKVDSYKSRRVEVVLKAPVGQLPKQN